MKINKYVLCRVGITALLLCVVLAGVITLLYNPFHVIIPDINFDDLHTIVLVLLATGLGVFVCIVNVLTADDDYSTGLGLMVTIITGGLFLRGAVPPWPITSDVILIHNAQLCCGVLAMLVIGSWVATRGYYYVAVPVCRFVWNDK